MNGGYITLIKEAIGTGNTIDEAKEAALTELNAGETEDVQFEVISFPKKKTLGLFGGALAQVRAYVEVPDKKPARRNAPAARPEGKRRDAAADNRSGEKSERTREKRAPEARKSAARPSGAAANAVTGAAANTESASISEIPSKKEIAVKPAGIPAEDLNPDSCAARAVAYLKTVLSGLGCEDLTFTVAELEDGAEITVNGDDYGVIIGRRGETLDALQYLASLASNKKGSGYYRVVLNVGNYREKREHTLEGVARKTAAQVLRTGRSRSLEPMNPYERRIIHTTVQKIDGVVSSSVGGGSARRVVISPEGGEGRFDRAPKYGDRRTASSSTAASAAESAEKKVDSASAPLYGRIN